MATDIGTSPVAAFQEAIGGWETDRSTGVYCLRNKADGKVYVGSSSLSLRRRFRDHLSYLRAGKHHNVLLQRAWAKYGEGSFECLVLELCGPADCVRREQHWIDFYKATSRRHGYNLAPLAGSMLGFKHTPESRAKIAAANKARGPDTRKKQADALRGRKHSEEAKARRAASLKAAYLNGKRKYRGHGPETRAKIGAAFRGKKISEEHRLKTIAGLTGRPVSPETRAKIGNANRGERCGISKLKDEQVIEIRRRHQLGGKKNSIRKLAKEFGVNRTTLQAIVQNKTWRHLLPKDSPE